MSLLIWETPIDQTEFCLINKRIFIGEPYSFEEKKFNKNEK